MRPQSGPADVDAVALAQQLAEMGVVGPGVSGTSQVNHGSCNGLGCCVGWPAATMTVGNGGSAQFPVSRQNTPGVASGDTPWAKAYHRLLLLRQPNTRKRPATPPNGRMKHGVGFGRARIGEIAHIEPVRPPAEVREWHFAYLAFLKATIAAMEARGLDMGAPMNANEIITDSQLNSTFDAWLEALASMTPEVRGVLEEAGCIRTDL